MLPTIKNSVTSIRRCVVRSGEILRSEGIRGFCRRSVSKCKEAAYSSNEALWFCRDLSEPLQDVQKGAALDLEIGTDEGIVSWLREHHREYGWLYVPEEIRLKEEEKHIYLVANYHKTIIGYIKIAVNKVYVLDYEKVLMLPARTAMIYDTFVLPEHRRKGVCSALIRESVRQLGLKGNEYVWCHIPPWNATSMRAYSSAGFRLVAHIRFRRILGRKVWTKDVQKMMRRRSREWRRDHGVL